jgi:hypothetical protein
VGACGGVEVGWVRIGAHNLAVERSPAPELWLAPEATVVARYELGERLVAGISAGIAAPVSRPTYTVETAEGARPLHRAAAVSGRAAASVECRF